MILKLGNPEDILATALHVSTEFGRRIALNTTYEGRDMGRRVCPRHIANIDDSVALTAHMILQGLRRRRLLDT